MIFIPSNPDCLTNKIIINIANTIASLNIVDIYALVKVSVSPISSPPIKAPGILPIPPNTAAINALR